MSGQRKTAVVVAIASLIALAVIAVIATWLSLSHSFRRKIYSAAEKIERESNGTLKVSIGDVDVSPFVRRATLHDVTLEFAKTPRGPLVLHVDSIDVKKWKQLKSDDGVIREQALEFHEVSSPQLDEQILQAPTVIRRQLAAPLVFDAVYDVSYQPQKQKELRLDVSVSSAKLGALSLDFTVSGLDLAKLEQLSRDMKARRTKTAAAPQLQQRTMALLMELSIHGARIVLQNDGLMELIYSLEAAEKGTTPDNARRQMLNRLRGECDKRAEPWMKSLCQPIIAFVEQPKSIRIALEPSSPVEVASLPAHAMTGGPQSLIDRLGLKLVANETGMRTK